MVDNQSEKMIRDSIYGFDVLKFIMAIVVIAMHTDPLANCTNDILILFYSSIKGIAVPCFFVMSGYLLAKSEKRNDLRINQNRLKINFIKMIKKYLIWTCIYFPISVFGFWWEGTNFLKATLSYIAGFFFQGKQFYSWQLWYLLAMIIGLGVLLLVNRMHISDKKLLGLGLIFYFCSEIVTFFVHNSNKMSGIMGILAGLCKIVFGSGGGRTLGGFTYLLIGVFLQRYFSDINQKKWLYILLLTQIISVCVPSVAIFLRIPRVMSIVGFF